MSLTRVSLCCVVLLAWASTAPVHSQDRVNSPGRASLRAQSPEPAYQPEPEPAYQPGPEPAYQPGAESVYQPGPDPLNPPAPEQNYYYPEGGTPGYVPLPSASGYVPIDPFGVRWSTRSDIGNGPGWSNGFQSFNGFLPIVFEPDRSLLFVNGRAIVTYDGKFTGTAGAGLRFYSPEIDRVFGGSFWYDYDDSNYKNYDQWGISLESLGRYFDVRLNAYVPSNDNQSTISSQLTGQVSFVGQHIGIGNNRLVENALRGGDLEIGGAMPLLGDYGVRSYIGGYYFQAPSVETTVGFKYRTELMVTEDVLLGIGASSDKLFGQNVFGSVTIYMPDGRPQRVMSRQPTRERLYANVDRNYRVNVYRRELHETINAINPDTGLAYVVHHVDNNSAPGTGDGSIRRPFGTLSDAPPGADIVFVHHNRTDGAGNPVLDGYDTGITLLDNQRLLGQGTEHFFTDLNHGLLTLPGNDNGPLPVITNVAGDVVTLANNNEVSGLQIGAPNPNAPAGNGIFGAGITNFNINRNVIQNAELAGISLIDAVGTGSITGNILNGNALENILVSNTGVAPLALEISGNDARASLAGAVIRADGSNIDANIEDNNFSNNNNNGVELLVSGGSVSSATITNNVANANGGTGIQATADGGTVNLSIHNNSGNSNSVNGIGLGTVNNGAVNVDASDNSFSSNLGSGLSVLADSGTVTFTDFSFTTLNANTLFGMQLDADNGGIINGIFDNNSLQNNLAGGLSSTLDHGSQGTFLVSNSVISGNTGFGLSFNALNGSTINHELTNNQIQNNIGSGILLNSSNSQVTLAMDSTNVTNNQGFGFSSNVTNSQSDITLISNVFSTNDNTGVQLSYSGNSLSTQLIDGNTISNNGLIAYDPITLAEVSRTLGGGITVEMHGTGGVPDLSSTIQNNTIQNNLVDGIFMNLSDGTGKLLTNNVTNNNILNNGRDGLSMQMSASSNAVLNATNNNITIHQRLTANQRFVPAPVAPNAPVLPTPTTIPPSGPPAVQGIVGLNGINLDVGADSVLNANIANNTIDGSSDGVNFNFGSGVNMNIRNDATLNATLTANIIRQNGVDGVHVGPDRLPGLLNDFHATQETSHINVSLQGNLIEQNVRDGVHLYVSQVSQGLPGFTGNANFTLNGNTIRNNGREIIDPNSGLLIRNGSGVNAEVRSGQMDLLMSNNTITGNNADGVLLRNSLGRAGDGSIPNIETFTEDPESILNAVVDGNTISNNGSNGVQIAYEDLDPFNTGSATRQGAGGRGDITLSNNIIDGNRDNGVYVLMNDQHDDAQDPGGWDADIVDETTVAETVNPGNLAELTFTAVGNTITNNGGGNPPDPRDLFNQVAGDGLFILVGTGSYVRADIRDNTFSGNFLDDFHTDSFVAGPQTPPSVYDSPTDTTTTVFLDRAARLDLRFTGNTGNSLGSVTSASFSQRYVNGQLKEGFFFLLDADVDPPVVQQRPFQAGFVRMPAEFRVEDTPTPVGSVLNGTNFFTDADSQFPRNNFLDSGYQQVPIGSLFP